MLAPTTSAIIRTQVSERLDCAPSDLLPGSPPLVKAHGPRLAEYYGLYIWMMDEAMVISAPPKWVAVVQAVIVGQTSEALHDPGFWRTALGAHVERVVGPSYQGYVDAQAFRPVSLSPESAPPLVRCLDPVDVPALNSLAAVCPQQDWEDSAIQPDHLPIFALEREGVLVAAASAPDDGSGVASVGVITHPEWRGRGYGRAVMSALTADRLTSGAILHYQTLRANVASVAVAHALGYHDLATALAVRLQR